MVCGAAFATAQVQVSKLLPTPEWAQPRWEPGTLAQDPPPNSGLHIEIMSGDRGINIIKKKTAVKPVVEVRDRNNLPIAGALVTFSSPGNGPSLVFVNGARSITVTTDAAGRATTVGMKPVESGKFQVNVSASFHAQTATASFSMTNVLTAAAAAGLAGTVAPGAAGGAGLSTGVIVAIVAVAAGAAVGIGVGLGHHGSSSTTSTSSTPTVTIGLGSGGSAGTPHLRQGWHW